jgi:hypothetical protein
MRSNSLKWVYRQKTGHFGGSRSTDVAHKIIGRHGSLLIMEVRDARGRKSLRYVRDGALLGDPPLKTG